MTRTPHRLTAVALTGLLALGIPALAGCGNVAENAIEQAAGDAIGGDVELSDGGLTVTNSDGTQMQLGENMSVPDNWPSGLPTYDGGSLVSVVVEGDGSTVNAVWTTEEAAEDAAATYGAALESAGYTAGTTSNMAGMANTEYTGGEYTVNVTALDADGTTTLMVNAEK
jgi:hypothetical protein